MSEAQSGGLIRDRSRRTRLQLGARASAVTVEAQLQSVVDLLMNYIGLMFNLYF